jgi:hypothetical protein
MVRPLIRSLLLLLLVSSGFHCKKRNNASNPLNPNILTGKLIVDDGCAQFAVEIVSGPFDPSKVAASWTDSDNGAVYTNVFRLTSVRGACAISYYGVSKGDVFQFRFDPNPPNQICYTCNVETTLALPPVPDAIMDVKKM